MKLKLLTTLLLSFHALAGGFDDLGYSARAVAMGGAGVAVHGTPYSLFYNPANIYSSEQMSFYTTYSNLLPGVEGDNLNYFTLSGVIPFSLGKVGGSATFLNTELWKEYTFSGTYAYELLSGLSVGGTVHLLGWSAAAAEGEKALSYNGFSVDAGAVYTLKDALPSFDIQGGLCVQNINQPSIAASGSPESSKLPFKVNMGVAFVSRLYGYTLAADVLKEKDVYAIRSGAEFLAYSGTLLDVPVDFLMRAGFYGMLKSDFTDQQGVTGGFGLRVDNYRFDYAYGQSLIFQGIGGSHKLSFAFNL